MTDPNASSEVIEVIARALQASRQANEAISLPTVLLPRRWFGEATGVRRVEAVKYWFSQCGFSAERSYQDGSHGYTELFRQLGSWYPWDDDIETIRQAHTEQTQLSLPEWSEARSEQSFEERLTLIRAMTDEQFYSLYPGIFNSWEDEEGHVNIEDGGPPRVGAPDLFVWHSRPDLPSWFFCEVKADGDYLGVEQYVWLREWWRVIDGRFLLFMLDPSV